MKNIIKLTESDLTRIVKRVIMEGDPGDDPNTIDGLMACKSGQNGQYTVIKGTKVLKGKRITGVWGTICRIE